MNGWAIFWGMIVVFSTISFFYMSGKILYKSVAELKEMFRMLDERHHASNAD